MGQRNFDAIDRRFSSVHAFGRNPNCTPAAADVEEIFGFQADHIREHLAEVRGILERQSPDQDSS